QAAQAFVVIAIDGGARDKGQALLPKHANRAEVVGLNGKVPVITVTAQLSEIRRRFQQSHGGQNHFLARFPQLMGNDQVIVQTQLAALATNRFTKVDNVRRGLSRLPIKLFNLYFGPEILNWPQRKFHSYLRLL